MRKKTSWDRAFAFPVPIVTLYKWGGGIFLRKFKGKVRCVGKPDGTCRLIHLQHTTFGETTQKPISLDIIAFQIARLWGDCWVEFHCRLPPFLPQQLTHIKTNTVPSVWELLIFAQVPDLSCPHAHRMHAACYQKILEENLHSSALKLHRTYLDIDDNQTW